MSLLPKLKNKNVVFFFFDYGFQSLDVEIYLIFLCVERIIYAVRTKDNSDRKLAVAIKTVTELVYGTAVTNNRGCFTEKASFSG